MNVKGISLRDYFAAKAMQAFLTNGNWSIDSSLLRSCDIPEAAYRMADEMIEVRNAKR